jgi:hypothetical protein
MTALFAQDVTIPSGALVALIVLGVIEVALAVFCIIDIVRRPAVTGDRKWVWIVIVVLFSLIGSIIYLAVGRAPAPAPEPPAAAHPTGDRAATAADLLYGPPQDGAVHEAPDAPPDPDPTPDRPGEP